MSPSASSESIRTPDAATGDCSPILHQQRPPQRDFQQERDNGIAADAPRRKGKRGGTRPAAVSRPAPLRAESPSGSLRVAPACSELPERGYSLLAMLQRGQAGMRSPEPAPFGLCYTMTAGFPDIVVQVECMDPLRVYLPLHPRVCAALYGESVQLAGASARALDSAACAAGLPASGPRAVVFRLHWVDTHRMHSLIDLRAITSQQPDDVMWSMSFGCINNNGSYWQLSRRDSTAAQQRAREKHTGEWKQCPSVLQVLHWLECDAAQLLAHAARPPIPVSMRGVFYAKDVSTLR